MATITDHGDHVKTESSVIEQRETADSSSRGSNDQLPKQEASFVENKVDLKFVMTFVGLCLTFVVAEITPLFLTTSFNIIAADLGALDKVIWLLIAPYIATGAIAPFVGNISDLLGRRGIILFSLVLVLVADIMMGAAPNFACYLVGSLFQGLSLGIQLLTIIAAASELVPVSKRGATIGYLAMGLFPFAPGAYYGEQIAARNWRWNYLLLGLVALIAFFVLFVFYHPPRPVKSQGRSNWQIIKHIDYVGFVLSVAGVVLFLIGINWGGQDYDWNSARVISFVVVGFVILVFYVIWELMIVKEPMFPARLITNKRHFIAVAVLCLTSGINFVPPTVFWTIQVYTVYGASYDQAGIWLLPLGFCIVGGAGLSALMISAFKRHIMWVLLFFCIIQTVGIACMGAVRHDNINTVWAPMVFGLLGVGGVLLPSQVIFSIISPDDLIGTSVALSLVIRMIGQVVGKSMFYNIIKTEIGNRAFNIMVIPAVQAGFTSVPRVEAFISQMTAGPIYYWIDRGLFPELIKDKIPALVAAGSDLYYQSFPIIYLTSIPWGVVACISCLFLYGIEKRIDDHVAVHLA